MNENEDGIFNTLTILSEDHSYSSDSGALVVNGGIGANSINCDFIQVTKRIKLCGDIFINDCMMVNNKILPVDGSCEIGSKKKRWGNIYANSIDCNNAYFNNEVNSTNGRFNYIYGCNDILLGKVDDEFIFKINCNDNSIKIRSNETIIYGKNTDIVKVSKQSNTITFNGNIAKSYKTLDITEDLEQIICNSSIIFVNILVGKSLNISNYLDDEIIISSGTVCRLVVKNTNENTLEILEDGGYDLSNKNDWIEFLFDGNNWVYIGGKN